MKSLLSNVFRYGVSILCLIWAFRGVPLADLWEVLRRFPPLPMMAMVLISLSAFFVLGLRLMYMAEPRLSFRSTFLASLVGQAVNNVLPARAGEVAKAAWLARDHAMSHGLTVDSCLGIVFMERFFDVNVLALLSLWFLCDLGRGGAASALVLCLAAGWGLLFLFRWRPQWAHCWERLPLPLGVAKFLTRFTLALTAQLKLRRLAWMSLSSLLLWAIHALHMGVALNGAAGLGLGWADVLGVFALSSLGMLLPSSPGALGVYEAVVVTALTAWGAPRDQALAAALFEHMAQFIPVTLAGGAVLMGMPSPYRPKS